MNFRNNKKEEIGLIKIGLIAYFSMVAYVSVLIYFLIYFGA